MDSALARVGDTERERVADLVADAAAEGYLRLDEVDERLDAALTARTRADLDSVVQDLPPDWLGLRAHREREATERREAAAGLRGAVTGYLLVMALLVGIWLTVGIVGESWYPWPIWPALGWGIAIVGRLRAAGRVPLLH